MNIHRSVYGRTGTNGSKWCIHTIWTEKLYTDVMMGAMGAQITSLTIVYSTVYSGADDRKHQSSASLAFVRGIHRWLVEYPHKGPVTRKMFSFDDVTMRTIKWTKTETRSILVVLFWFWQLGQYLKQQLIAHWHSDIQVIIKQLRIYNIRGSLIWT